MNFSNHFIHEKSLLVAVEQLGGSLKVCKGPVGLAWTIVGHLLIFKLTKAIRMGYQGVCLTLGRGSIPCKCEHP